MDKKTVYLLICVSFIVISGIVANFVFESMTLPQQILFICVDVVVFIIAFVLLRMLKRDIQK